VNFSQFQPDTHISRVNCVEITGNKPRQPANEIFSSLLNVDFNSARLTPWIQGVLRTHLSTPPPLKRALSATVDQSSKRTVADNHRPAAYQTLLTSFPAVPTR